MGEAPRDMRDALAAGAVEDVEAPRLRLLKPVAIAAGVVIAGTAAARVWRHADRRGAVAPARRLSRRLVRGLARRRSRAVEHDRSPSDALVFFGASGDLAYEQIFPALQALARRGHLELPVVGVAKSGWTLEQLVERAKASIMEHGRFDEPAFAKLAQRLRYVDGDYADGQTFARLRTELGDARRPLHYLAIPPSLFATVVEQLQRVGLTRDARVVLEKPFGRDRASARTLDAIVHSAFPEERVFRIDHFLGKEAGTEPPLLPLRERVPRADLEPALRRERPDHDGGDLRRRGRGHLYEELRRHPRRRAEPHASRS